MRGSEGSVAARAACWVLGLLSLAAISAEARADLVIERSFEEHEALAATRDFYGHVTTLLGNESWGVRTLREASTRVRARRAAAARVRSLRIEREETDEPDKKKTDLVEKDPEPEFADPIEAALASPPPPVTEPLAELDLGETAVPESGGPVDAATATVFADLGLSETEIADLIAEVPELAVMMADYAIAFGDGTVSLAVSLSRLFSGLRIDWSSTFANRETLMSSRARAIREQTNRGGSPQQNAETEAAVRAYKIKKVVRSVFKIVVGVGIGLVFWVLVRRIL